jgi:hypothetical protein
VEDPDCNADKFSADIAPNVVVDPFTEATPAREALALSVSFVRFKSCVPLLSSPDVPSVFLVCDCLRKLAFGLDEETELAGVESSSGLLSAGSFSRFLLGDGDLDDVEVD